MLKFKTDPNLEGKFLMQVSIINSTAMTAIYVISGDG